jgi:hypothetical protein
MLMSATATMRRPIGIVSLKEMLNSIESAIENAKNKVGEMLDNADTKRAERKYEKIRKELLEAGTKYTETEYNKCAQLVDEVKNLSANDRMHLRDSVRKGKAKEDGKNRRRAALSIGLGLAETGVEIVTGQSVIGAVLGTFGITAPPATTIIAATIAAGTAFYSLYKLHQSKKFTEAERLLSSEDFMKDFSAMVEEVKTLCAEIEKAKSEDIKALKARNGKNMSAKEFKKAFAMSAYKIIHNMNLQYISKENVAKAFNIEEEVKAFEDELKEQEKETQPEPEAKSDEKPQAQTKEEQERLLQEEKMQEQQAQSEERENG